MKKNCSIIFLLAGFISYPIFGNSYSAQMKFINNLSTNGGLIISAARGANYRCIGKLTSSFPYKWGQQVLPRASNISLLTATIHTLDFNDCDNPSYTSEGFAFYYQPPGASGTFYLGGINIDITNTGATSYAVMNPTSWLNIKVMPSGNNGFNVLISGAPN